MEEDREVCIYALCDPRDGRIGYVGSSFNPALRFNGHQSDMQHLLTEKAKWLRKLRREGVKATIRILDRVPPKRRLIAETAWIDKLQAEGHPVTNNLVRSDGRQKMAASPKEVAAFLQVSEESIDSAIRSGELPFNVAPDGRILVWWASLEDYPPCKPVKARAEELADISARRIAALETRVASLEGLLNDILDNRSG